MSDKQDKPAKAPAKRKPAARKKTASKTTARKSANTAAKTAKAERPKPAAPNKVGATRAAATTSKEFSTVEFKERAITKARSAANEGKTRTGDAISGLGRMIEGSAKTIDENVGEKYGDYARTAADAVSSFADRLNSKDVDQLVEEAREFVRKKPAVAIGAAAAVGFLVSRLVKSGMSSGDDEA